MGKSYWIMHKFIKTLFNNQIYIFLFISTWFCIDTNFENILSLKKDINVKNFFLSIRSSLPLFFFATLVIITFANKTLQKIYYTNNRSFNFILFSIAFFFIFQLYGLITTGNDILNSYYILLSIIAICFTI